MIRALMAILLGAAIIAALLFLPTWSISTLVFILAVIGLYEYSKMFFKERADCLTTIVAGSVCALAMLLLPGEGRYISLVVIAVFFVLCGFLAWRSSELRGTAEKLALIMMGVIYLGVAFPFWGVLLSWGNDFVLVALIPACLCDTFGYIVGKTIGRHKLAPKVSPNKTVEGFIGALLGSFIGTFASSYIFLKSMNVPFLAVLALIIWITSPMGDLVESMLKRSAGVKDSGCLIPGHGGILDRLDALIFTAPAVYAYMTILNNM